MTPKRRQLVSSFCIVAIGCLLAYGIHRDGRQKWLDRSLIEAIGSNRTAAALDLLDRGADPNALNLNYYEPTGLIDRLRSIVSRPKENRDVYGALQLAAGEGNLEIVDHLLRRGAKVDANGGQEHFTPLLLAANNGSGPVMRRLIDAGANPNLTGTSTRIPTSAIYYAVLHATASDVRYLLDHGASLDTPPGKEVLTQGATFNRNAGVMELLLHHGVSPNTELFGSPLLFHAVNVGNEPVVRLLLSRGADPNARDGGGLSALDRALARQKTTRRRMKLDGIIELLRSAMHGKSAA